MSIDVQKIYGKQKIEVSIIKKYWEQYLEY